MCGARGQGTDPWRLMPGMKSLEDLVSPDRLWAELTRRRSDVGTICCLLWPEYPAEYNIVTEQNISSGSVLQAVIRILLTVCPSGAWPILSILLWLFWKFERLSAVSLGQLMDTRSLTFGNVSILVLRLRDYTFTLVRVSSSWKLHVTVSVCPENELFAICFTACVSSRISRKNNFNLDSIGSVACPCSLLHAGQWPPPTHAAA